MTTTPARGRVAATLAAAACAASCAVPFLLAAGVVTGAGAVLLRRTLLALAAGLAVVALATWLVYRRGKA